MSLSTLLSSLPLWFALAFGQVSYGFSQQTDAKGTAFVVVSSDTAGSVSVEVRGDDGTVVKKTVKVKAGQEKRITWVQKKSGTVHYTAHVESGDNFADFEFDCARPLSAAEVRLTPRSGRTDLVDRHRITYETSFPIERYEFSVYDPAGEVSDRKTMSGDTIDAGERFTIQWDSYDDVFMVELNAFGPSGEQALDRRVPWSLEIPHTEVNFDSGKSVIKPDEAPKVDEVWAILAHELDKLDRANEAVNADLSAQLYIVGYTDTVGNNRDNQVLSEARAKAIANYFKKKGAWCEIYYAGMGERGLAVQTGDSVDEVRNRRALYLLSPQTPGGGGQVPGPGAWKKLTDASPRTIRSLPPLPASYIAYKDEQREARKKKFGGGQDAGDGDVAASGNGDTGSAGGAGGSNAASSEAGGGGGGASSGDGGGAQAAGGEQGPPPVEPKRGCDVRGDGGAGPLALVLAGLWGVMRRRRTGSKSSERA